MSTMDSLAQSGVQPEVKPAGQEAGSWGNSAPLGLAAFAVTTFMLSMINAELMKAPITPASPSCARSLTSGRCFPSSRWPSTDRTGIAN